VTQSHPEFRSATAMVFGTRQTRVSSASLYQASFRPTVCLPRRPKPSSEPATDWSPEAETKEKNGLIQPSSHCVDSNERCQDRTLHRGSYLGAPELDGAITTNGTK